MLLQWRRRPGGCRRCRKQYIQPGSQYSSVRDMVNIITLITGRKMAFHERKVYILPKWVGCGLQHNYTWRNSKGGRWSPANMTETGRVAPASPPGYRWRYSDCLPEAVPRVLATEGKYLGRLHGCTPGKQSNLSFDGSSLPVALEWRPKGRHTICIV